MWVVKPQTTFVQPIFVRIGLSDGAFTEVVGDELREGTEVVLGESRAAVAGDVINPLGPPKFRGTPRKDKDSK